MALGSTRLLPLLASLLVASFVPAQEALTRQAQALELQGQFREARALLTGALTPAKAEAPNRRELEFELDRLSRIQKDYKLTKEALFDALKRSVRDLTPEEFSGWIAEGRFDARTIDGETRFFNSSVSNLFFRAVELEPRRTPPRDRTDQSRAHLAAVTAIREAALREKTPYVLPHRFRNTMSVTVDADAAPAGETIRAWLPFPREFPFQRDIALISAAPAALEVNDPRSTIRAVHQAQPAKKGEAAKFEIVYEYTALGVRFEIDPELVLPCDPHDPALEPFLREGPHVQFTPAIRALSQEIVGTETNPARKTRKCYDWISDNIRYSYATEYSTIRNIGGYCLEKRYGDCGQEALLFITLCRLNGIPARFQSGWNLFPGEKTIHDWTEIYLAPHGWVPVDPYMGIWAMRYARGLTRSEVLAVRDFYFGGLDPWRMAANSDHCQELAPAKRSLRSDTVDFQRGELEWGDHNLYFDTFDYSLTVQDVSAAK